jgi:hypothetical protein
MPVSVFTVNKELSSQMQQQTKKSGNSISSRARRYRARHCGCREGCHKGLEFVDPAAGAARAVSSA